MFVGIDRDVHQQGQPSDNTTNIPIENQKEQEQEQEEEIDDDDDLDNEDDVDEDDIDEDNFDAVVDDKTTVEHKTNDNDHDSNYQTPPTGDDNKENNLDSS